MQTDKNQPQRPQPEIKTFWMVKRGRLSHRADASVLVHEHSVDAYREAQRLAVQHPQETFYVLRAIGYVYFDEGQKEVYIPRRSPAIRQGPTT